MAKKYICSYKANVIIWTHEWCNMNEGEKKKYHFDLHSIEAQLKTKKGFVYLTFICQLRKIISQLGFNDGQIR